MASGPRRDFTWMERCLRSRDFDVGIESNEASNSAVNLGSVEIILDLCFKNDYLEDNFQVLGQATNKTDIISLSSAPRFKDKESTMDATASKVGSVFREINVAQPFHHPEENQDNWCDDKDDGLVCNVMRCNE